MSLPLRCLSSATNGDQLVQLHGTSGETSDGIVCLYGRAGDLPETDPSGLASSPAVAKLAVGIAQFRVDDSRIGTFKRIANSLTTQSDRLDVELGDNVTVNARYMRTGRPGSGQSAWLLAESAAAVTYVTLRVAVTDEFSPDQARQELSSLTDLLDLGG
jgi:hypothetical protein